MKFGNGPVTTCIQFWQDLGKDINRTRVDLGLSGPGLDMGLPGPTPRRATVVRRPVPNGSARRPGRFDSVLDEWRTAKLLELRLASRNRCRSGVTASGHEPERYVTAS